MSSALEGEAPRAETLTLLGELVAFDTVSSRSNRALINHVMIRLKNSGIEARILPSSSGDKANLWATIGPEIDGGIVWSGHSDVVPVDGQSWQTDPFDMSVREGRAYGRGTTDMKGFIACAITALERHRHAPLRRPIHLALSFDEEVGCLGAPELLGWLTRHGPRPSLALIGEPTEMQVVNSHKGFLGVRTEITGVAAHSGLSHQGVSAIGLAGRVIELLRDIESELSRRDRDDRFVPDHTTISVNRIGGGTAINILAGEAWLEWDVRTLPHVIGREVLSRFEQRLQEEILDPVRSRHATVGARSRVVAEVPSLAPEHNGSAEALAKRLLGVDCPAVVAFGTEAGQFQGAGMSVVVVGPGSMQQGHRPDEFVSLSQLARCEAFLDRVTLALTE
jgi:acetylornithine deacetylase